MALRPRRDPNRPDMTGGERALRGSTASGAQHATSHGRMFPNRGAAAVL